jgi:UDP-2,3-diacylglucosamine pyrophosphatase LpxH
MSETISRILKDSEPDVYGENLVHLTSDNRNIFVISDLHMAAGLNANGNYDGTENFFADRSFYRFMEHLKIKIQRGKKALLIINGDFVDFLRIRNFPKTYGEFRAWSDLLAELGIFKSPSELESSVSKKESIYGLKTHDYKSVYKLDVCFRGHACVFESLSAWLMDGHELLIMKGNHDLEWYWKNLRDFLRLLLAKEIVQARAKDGITDTDLRKELRNTVIPQIRFVDDKLIIDRKIYIEHGHRFERFTRVEGGPLLDNGVELTLPFGSFFNRYLINRIELAYPFIDDIRPRQKVLPLLIRERFPLALKLLVRYVPFTFRMIPKKQFIFAFRYLFQSICIIGIPAVLTIIAIYKTWHHTSHPAPATHPSLIQIYILPQLKNVALLSLSYFFGRVFSMLSLSAPTSFYPSAKKIFGDYRGIEFVTFGHTHDPEQKKSDGQAYYNTGTWIPVYELDAANVRLDKTYTFLQFFHDDTGNMQTSGLMRWNDDAGRTELMELRDRI